MKELTMICCYNDSRLYDKLIDNVNLQTVSVEMIGIDNTKNRFSSCSKAYNYAISKVKTEYVVFLHQDIVFVEPNTLERILKYLYKISDFDILGLAGAKNGSKYVLTNIFVGDLNHYGGTLRVSGLQECDTLDECIFGGKTECFRQYPFDEKICNNWHLYAVERSLAAKKRGNKVYVCDVSLLHLSKGNVDINFDKTFLDLCRYYRDTFKEIHTPCAVSKTNDINLLLWSIKSKIKRKVKS